MAEYIARKRLSKLGFSTDLKDLDTVKAEIFCLIDAELQQLENQELRKAQKNGKR